MSAFGIAGLNVLVFFVNLYRLNIFCLKNLAGKKIVLIFALAKVASLT